MKGNIYNKGLVLLIIVVIALIIVFGFYLEKNSGSKAKLVINDEAYASKNDSYDIGNSESSNENNSEETKEKKVIIVDVSGAVVNPGIYQLEEGSRINDAIEIAGGFNENANIQYISKYINKAKKLIDGQKIYIPLITDNVNDMESNIGGIEGLMEENITIINLNTASKEQLMTLNGIGESYAERIIEYREKNGFKSVEDLKNIKGIGEKRFEELKKYVTVE